MVKNMATETKAVNFRFPLTLIDRIDRHVERLRAEQPGVKVDRSDVVRLLLIRGLDDVEPKKAGRK